MKTSKLARPVALAVAASVALASLTAHAHDENHKAKHVIVISVDGLHQSDLEHYIATHANSTLAKFVYEGASYSNARTPFPSDSFPGLTAIVTGVPSSLPRPTLIASVRPVLVRASFRRSA